MQSTIRNSTMWKHPFRLAIESGASADDFRKLFAADAVIYAPMLTKPVTGARQVFKSLTLFCALVLGALMIAGTTAIWIWPMAIGQFFGSLTVACFSFGSFLALANLVDLFTATLAGYARTVG